MRSIREELVRRLIEYKRYKSVLDEMREMEENRSFRAHRGNVTRELRKIASVALTDVELESLTLFRLLKTFERLVQKIEDQKNRVVHTVVKYNYSIVDQREYILSKLKPGKKLEFNALFLKLENRIHAIVTFLALLEMLNLQLVSIVQGIGPNNFWVTLDEISANGEPGDGQTDEEE